MNARIFIFLFDVLRLAWEGLLGHLSDVQRKKPLPDSVADFYEPERYQAYLNRVADEKKAGWIEKGVNLVIDSVILFSGIFAAIDRAAGGNPYLVTFLLFAVYEVISVITETAFHYYDKFVIEEKYGLNKQTRRGFVKDTAISTLLSTLLIAVLLALLVFFGTHMETFTNGFAVSAGKAALICIGIAAVFGAFALGASALSVAAMKLQYKFTPMPEGELRTKIETLQASSKKKVKQIYVYDESKKSTSKNAFLLKFLWHREFGIADNFLNENAEDELLAVLSHEIGHLKHRKNLLNWISCAEPVLFLILLGAVIVHPGPVLAVSAWVRASFGISVTNYILLLFVIMDILTPLFWLTGIFGNFRSRREEYEADREAVKNGFGDALIRTFKQMSSDELINVNPHPVIEFLEYNHPGMAKRISAIRNAEKR